jgi:hypothetical protein
MRLLSTIFFAMSLTFFAFGVLLLESDTAIFASAECADVSVSNPKAKLCTETPTESRCEFRCEETGGFFPCGSETIAMLIDECQASPPIGTPGQLCERPSSCDESELVICQMNGICQQTTIDCGDDEVVCNAPSQYFITEEKCKIEYSAGCGET